MQTTFNLKFRPGEVASGDPECLLLRCCMLKFDNIYTYFLCLLPLVWLLIYCVMEPYAYSLIIIICFLVIVGSEEDIQNEELIFHPKYTHQVFGEK